MNIQSIKNKLNLLASEYAYLKRKYKEEKEHLQKCKQTEESHRQAQAILQEIAKKVQQKAYQTISQTVTRCLRLVWPERDYRVEILTERKRNHTESQIVIYKKEVLITDPVEEMGGGVIDVISFALRLVCLLMSKPTRRKVLFLDEPFRQIHESKSDAICVMLESLSKEMSIQIVMVTHNSNLITGKVIRIQ